MIGAHAAALSARELPGAAAARIAAYLDLLAAWNERVNLTGARTPEERVAVLVAPALAAESWLEGDDLIDIGSGNGSPGLVLALLRPGLRVTLLEPRQRRWAFLREAARAAGRPDVAVLRLRHDQYPGPPASSVTLRALRLPLPALAPLVATGGRLLLFGQRRAPEPPFREAAASPGLQVLRRECAT